jgi:hypothetical protein
LEGLHQRILFRQCVELADQQRSGDPAEFS